MYREPGGRKSHDNEIKAFRKIRRTGLDETHMVGYYCSYVHKNVHHALLEYADYGTLEDFMKRQASPQTDNEIFAFWRGILSVIDAIVRLHGPRSNTNDGSESSDYVT